MWLLLSFVCVGCAPDDTGAREGCSADPATLEVGAGSLAFESAADEAALTMVHGPQGGWHVLASARVTGMGPIVSLHYTIDAGSQRVSDNTYRVQLVNAMECGGDYPGMYGYLDVRALVEGDRDTPPELLAGQELLITIEATDPEGHAAGGTLTGMAALDPIDEPPTDGP